MGIHSLTKMESTDESGKIVKEQSGPILILTTDDIPELDDYNIDEEVVLHTMARVRKITKPEQKENEIKSSELAKYSLELIEIEIMNQKEDRQKAERMGLKMNEYKEVQSKRRAGEVKI